jgi:hypothetical protein
MIVLQIQMNYEVLWNRKSSVIYSGILVLQFAYKLRKLMVNKVLEFRYPVYLHRSTGFSDNLQIFWLVKWWPWLMLLQQCDIKLYNFTHTHIMATYIYNILTFITGIKAITLPGRLSSWRNSGNNVSLGCAIHRRHILLKSSVILTLNEHAHMHMYFMWYQYNATSYTSVTNT